MRLSITIIDTILIPRNSILEYKGTRSIVRQQIETRRIRYEWIPISWKSIIIKNVYSFKYKQKKTKEKNIYKYNQIHLENEYILLK